MQQDIVNKKAVLQTVMFPLKFWHAQVYFGPQMAKIGPEFHAD